MKKCVRLIAVIQLLLILLLFAMMFSCAPQKDTLRTEVVFECNRDTLRIYAVEYVHDARVVDSLKEENHLLRVEIDHLKNEKKQMENAIKLLTKVKEMKNKVESIQNEICEQATTE